MITTTTTQITPQKRSKRRSPTLRRRSKVKKVKARSKTPRPKAKTPRPKAKSKKKKSAKRSPAMRINKHERSRDVGIDRLRQFYKSNGNNTNSGNNTNNTNDK